MQPLIAGTGLPEGTETFAAAVERIAASVFRSLPAGEARDQATRRLACWLRDGALPAYRVGLWRSHTGADLHALPAAVWVREDEFRLVLRTGVRSATTSVGVVTDTCDSPSPPRYSQHAVVINSQGLCALLGETGGAAAGGEAAAPGRRRGRPAVYLPRVAAILLRVAQLDRLPEKIADGKIAPDRQAIIAIINREVNASNGGISQSWLNEILDTLLSETYK